MTQNKPERVLKAIYNQPWVITEDWLETISTIAERESDFDIESLATRQGQQSLENPNVEYRDNGVAVVSIIGPIFRYANLYTEISGATSLQMVSKSFQAVLDDPGIRSIVLNLDTPGGQASGINEFSELIYNSREIKPIYAYVGGDAASAGYWIASAASEIWADATAWLGSIGVVIGSRKKDSNAIEIVSTASPKKRPDPETEEGRSAILARADALAEKFIRAVARNRNVSADTVLREYGQGDVFIGDEAVSVGMADKISSLEELIVMLQENRMGRKIMDYQTLKVEHEELYAQVKAEGKQEAEKAAEGKEAEARQQAQTEAVSMAKAVLGEETAQKLEKAIQTGLTADQLKQAQSLFGSQDGQEQPKGQGQQILESLQQAHGHQGLNPGGGTQPGAQNPLTANAEQRAGKK
jgi:ClpP class serine protease